MGDTISSLVFRPPRPTPIHPSEYFYLDVDVHSPLCTNKRHRDPSSHNDNCGDGDHGSCASVMCLDTEESDLASLDATHGVNIDSNLVGMSPQHNNSAHGTVPPPPNSNNNIRNGQIYKIPAFFIRRRNATQTLLFSHGNAEDLGMMYNRMKDLAMVLGVNIMAYDYTGYGLSIPGPAHGNTNRNNATGSNNEGPSENMIYRNIEAAFHYLTQIRKIPPHQIILYGRSLGSGPSCYLAAKSALNGASVGGLILHSPFLSVYKVVADLNGLDLGMVGDLFHNEKRARNVRCPTLIIHGRQDEVVPFWHAPRLLAAIPPEFRAVPYYVENMGHNHIESRCREQYIKVVVNFLRMGVWNNRNNHLVGTQQQQQENLVPSYRGPSPIPIHERASPSETKENASFYVNKTWLRHAKVLLKEVFADAGCYANTTMGDANNTRYSPQRRSTHTAASSTVSTRGQGQSVAAAGSSKRRANEPLNHNRYSNNNQGALSDARDDEEDEFAPWRQQGSSAGNHQNQTRSATAPNHAAANVSISEYPNGSGYRAAPSGKILTTRRDSTNQNNSSRGSSSSGAGGNNTPRYRKAQSMNSSMDRVGQLNDTCSVGVKSMASSRRPLQKQQSQQQQQQKGSEGYSRSMSQTQQSQSHQQQQKGSENYSRSKSMQLLEGMSRQRRY